MKKYAFALVAFALFATACSKNDDPVQPEPYKVTNITCTKNGSTEFTMSVIYNIEDGSLNQITHRDDINYYRTQSNEIYVINNDQKITTSYTLSGDRITRYTLEKQSPEVPGGSYVYEKFEYKYSGNYWNWTQMTWSRIVDGELKSFTSAIDHAFTWSNSNITEYKAGNNYIEFEYTDEKHPENYPFRILTDTNLEDGYFDGGFIGEENFLPINFLLGRNNNNLLKSAKWYRGRDSGKLGEYIFDHSLNSVGYVTQVKITENIYNEGEVIESNDYTINLDYQFNPN